MKLITLSRGGLCNSLRRASRLQIAVFSLLTPGLTFWTNPIQANPSGGVVVSGNVSFSGGSGNLQVNQASQRAIVDWASFSIDAGELTQFNQPGAASAILNRVTGGNPSEIHGALKANGNVFVINPNGILIGASGVIDVHGLALSTLDVDNGEFLAAGDMVFKGGSGDITNMGRINAIGGDVFLIGRTVTNTAGAEITARNGTVGIGVGEEVLLKANSAAGNERVFVRAKGSGVSGTGILNEGSIEGASVELKAHGNMYALAINNKGSIRATGVSNSGGRVTLRGVGGSVSNSGSIRASAPSVGNGGQVLIQAAYAKVDGMIRAERGAIKIASTGAAHVAGSLDASTSAGVGGNVEIEAVDIALSSSADVDVSGQSGGGVVKIGGGFQGADGSIKNAISVMVDDGAEIRSSALEFGNGGVVVLWSDHTTVFEGSIEARGAGAVGNGGFAEISGKQNLGFGGLVDLTANHGLSGTLLLDPTNVTISTGGASTTNVNNVALSNSLDLGTNVLITSNFGSGGAGNITVNAAVEWYAENAATTPGTLSLLATGNVVFNDDVRSAGTGGINIVAGWDGATGLVDPLSGTVETTPGAFDMAAVLATMNDGNSANDAAGNNSGSVFLASTTRNINVGSRYGDTNVAAHDLTLKASDSGGEEYVQLGFRDTGYEWELATANPNGERNEWWGNAAGNAQGKDYISLLGGTRFAGGGFDGAGSGTDGDITIGLSGRLDMRTGDDSLSYAQIGHGGSVQTGFESSRNNNAIDQRITRDGYVMDSYDNGRQFFSSSWRTNIETNPYNGGDLANARDYRVKGDITVHADEDILVMAAPTFGTDANIAGTASGDGMYAMIGHGGSENHGSFHGDVTVIAEGADAEGIGINLIGGRGHGRYAQIGHGSSREGNRFSILDQTRSGFINVRASAGGIRLQGYNEPVTGSESAWVYSQVQIGHGGAYANAPAFADHSSQFDRGTFRLPDGTVIAGQDGQDNHTAAAPDNSASGDITVYAGGSYVDPADPNSRIGIGVKAGNLQYSYGLIGHGGVNQRALTSTENPGATGQRGNIDVQAVMGDIVMEGGDERQSNNDGGYGFNFVQIGHGGYDVDGEKQGTINVAAGQDAAATDGDILFTAGKMYRSHAKIGHGGNASSGDIVSLVDQDASIDVIARGSISFISGASGNHNALIDSEGYANYWFNERAKATPVNRVGFWQTQERFLMIGHGGYESDGVLPNKHNITVTAGTGDLMNADGDVNTGGITFIAGDSDNDFAQIGHGGYSNGSNDATGFDGDLTVTANGGSVVFDGSIAGKKTIRRDGSRSLDGVTLEYTVASGDDAGANAYVMIGNGGHTSRGDHSGEITVTSYGGVDFLGGMSTGLTAQSLDGTLDDLSHLTGAVQNGANVWVHLSGLIDTAATAATEEAQPIEAPGNVKPGSVVITLSDGTVIRDLADDSSDDRDGNLYDAAGNLVGLANYEQGMIRFSSVVGGGTATVTLVEFSTIEGFKEGAFAQLGHGGYNSDGPDSSPNGDPGHSGSITVNVAGDVRFHAGDFFAAYAQLGHGGYGSRGGANSGDITIAKAVGTSGGKLELLGGNGERHYDYGSYVQVGHGGYDSDGNHYGDIRISNGMNAADGLGVLLKAGSTLYSYAQIGHGGHNSRSGTGDGAATFGLNGDIVIQTDGDISVVAGTGKINNSTWNADFNNSAMIGHGGYDADPSTTNNNGYDQNGGITFVRNSSGDTNAGEAGVGDEKWGHFGDIILTSTAGNINFLAGSTVALADRLDGEGNPLPLPADPNGFLISEGEGHGRFLYSQVGHGGYAAGGNHHGDIEVTAQAGSVNVVGGMMTTENEADRYHWAQIGHAGINDQGHKGRSDEHIIVKALGAGGNVVVAGGTGRNAPAQIGNGGYGSDGTHLGSIEVVAGNDIVLQGGMALDRTVTRVGEYQDIFGADGGNANDIGHYQYYYGTGGLGLLLMDQAAAAGGGQMTRLMNDNITAGTVEFRLQKGEAFDPGSAPHITDDGSGNLVTQQVISDGAIAIAIGVTVGTINYTTGEVTWNVAVAEDALSTPDVFVNYETVTPIALDSYRSLAMIGHGGTGNNSVAGVHPEAGVTAGFTNTGHSGDIDVTAGGSVIGMGGNNQRAFVQIGHGGDDAAAPTGHFYSGDITVVAGTGVKFRGGNGVEDDFSVGFDFGGDGNIDSVPDIMNDGISDNLDLRSTGALSSIAFAYAQIGHGGYNSGANGSLDNNQNDPLDMTDGHNGAISVTSLTGDIDFMGGGVRGYGHYAKIGHGGFSTDGNHFGNINVDATAGSVIFEAGGSSYSGAHYEKRSYAQVGHGGYDVSGNLGRVDETIRVNAGEEISFSGGSADGGAAMVPWAAHVYVLNRSGNNDENLEARGDARQNFALLGHGGVNVYGDKQGDIDVLAGTGIDFNGGLRLEDFRNLDNGSNLNFAQIGHGGYFSIRHYDSFSNPAGADRSDTYNLFSNLDGTGQVFFPLDASGNYLPDGFEGNINVVTGRGDIVFSSGNGTATYAMIGHGGYQSAGDHKGDITVEATEGSVVFNSDVDNGPDAPAIAGSGNQTFTMIGHGGFYSDGDIGSGTVDGVAYTTNIDVRGGAGLRFDGGDSDAFAMIGHGGASNHGVAAYTSVTPDYYYGTNILYRPGSRSGNINVLAGAGDIRFTGGNTDGDNGFVKIGHGGYQISANPDAASQYGDGHSGSITVNATTGKIEFEGGERTYQYAQIGHGGNDSFGNHGGDGNDNRLDSDIIVGAATGIRFQATGNSASNDAYNFAMIGHGGRRSSFRDVTDISSSNYAILQPYGSAPFSLTANGGVHPWMPSTTNPDGLGIAPGTGNLLGTVGVAGAGTATLGAFMGDITVTTTAAGGDIDFYAPNETLGTSGGGSNYSFVQIGHGGFRNFADVEGDVTVTSAGAINFVANQGIGTRTANKQANYALLGHGGYESGGEFVGDITVSSTNSVNFKGADSAQGANAGFVQLGHGGYNSDDDQGEYTSAAADAAGVAKATDNDAGNSGNIQVTVTNGDMVFEAGRDAYTYAQLGHGGYSTRDSHTGTITVDVSGGIAFYASTDLSDAVAGFNPGTNSQAYVQLGHGGYDADGTHGGVDLSGNDVGSISVKAGSFTAGSDAGKGIVFRSGDSVDGYSLLGHGGTNSRTYGVTGATEGLVGNINVEAGGDILFVAGTYRNEPGAFTSEDGRQYTQLGHGGYDADNTYASVTTTGQGNGHSGDISVVSTHGSVSFLAGDITRAVEASVGTGGGRFHYAQLGHGGYSTYGDHHGNITVRAGIEADGTVNNLNADVYFAGGQSYQDDFGGINFALLGNGGRTARGNIGLATETISVMAGRDVVFEAGEDNGSFAQIGNGGQDSDGDHLGNIQVYAERNVTFKASQLDGLATPGNGHTTTYTYTAGLGSGYDENLDRAANFEADTDTADGSAIAGEANSHFQDVIPTTVVILIRDDSGNPVGTIVDDGNGNLIALADFTVDANGDLTINPDSSETITANQVLGSINYDSGDVFFLQDVNPGANGGYANIVLTIEHTDADVAYAQIGHGGYDTDLGDAGTIGMKGDISVVARTGSMSFEAGTDAGNYVQVGHGGHETDGSSSGNIFMRAAGDITLKGGDGDTIDSDKYVYAQIGHGGWSANTTATVGHSGVIKVSSGTGALTTELGTGAFDDIFDYDLDGTRDRVNFGVDVSTTGILLQGGTGQVVGGADVNDDDSYAQIGHGGRSASGNHEGDIAVAATKDISLLSGNAYRAYTQIGHGGLAANGNLSGNISVITESGRLTMDAGSPLAIGDPSPVESYSLVGHGDDRSPDSSNSTGSRSGDIFVLVDNWLAIPGGADYAGFGHRSRDANNGMTAGSSSMTLFSVGDQVINADDEIAIESVLGSGNQVTVGAGNLTLTAGAEILYDSAAELNLLATQNITFLDRVQNNGTGTINVVAGWDRQTGVTTTADPLGVFSLTSTGAINYVACPPLLTFNFADIKSGGAFATDGKDAFGNNMGLVVIGDGTQGIRLSVGSREGATNLLGYGLQMNGGTTTDDSSQLGFYATAGNSISGAINVDVKQGGVDLNSGTATGTFTQIGHGGMAATAGLAIDASITISFCEPGELSLQAGGTSAYSQIGHGGISYVAAEFGGKIDINGAGSIEVRGGTADKAYGQIGHGGDSATSVAALDDDDIELDVFGAIDLIGGNSGTWTNATIGHGGANTNAMVVTDADILINTDTAGGIGGGAITLDANGGSNASAQIGHGGARSDGSSHFGNRSGNITIGAATSVVMTGGNGTDSYTQIGHGGEGGNGVGTAGTAVGFIDIITAGLFRLLGGSGTGAYSQVGHGGDNSEWAGSGIIDLTAMTIDLDGGTGGTDAYGQIGHGGHGNDQNQDSAITLTATTGGITVDGGTGGSDNYAQIGHGGNDTNGTLDGDIVINMDITNPLIPVPTSSAGGITVKGGSVSDAYAQIGHGGDTGNNVATSGNIVIFTAGIAEISGGSAEDAYAQIGHGGHDNDGAHGKSSELIGISALGGVDLNGGATGNRTYAQIGHGGADSDGALAGIVAVNFNPLSMTALPGGAVTLDSGAAIDSYTQIGLGGSSADGTKTGDTFVNGASARVKAGAGANAYSQIGAGSGVLDTTSDFGSGDIISNTSVTTTVGGVDVDASTGAIQAYAQIGAGGLLSDNNDGGESFSGTTTVSAAGALVLTGGVNSNNAARVGLGGAGLGTSGSPMTLTNAHVTVSAASVSMTSGSGAGAFTQIGAGGGPTGASNTSASAITGNVSVTSTSGGIVLNAASGANAGGYSQIGNGGSSHVGAKTGTVAVSAATTLDLNGGGSAGNFAQIGSGGMGGSGAISGAVTATSGNALGLTGGAGGGSAQIGHGGNANSGSKTGAITVNAENVAVTGGGTASAIAQIGHGGTAGSGQIDGTVSVVAGGAAGSGDIKLTSAIASARIGSGGSGYSGGVSNGNILASTENGDILLDASGGGINAIVQIGHGGINMTGAAIDGTITVDTTTNGNITDDEVLLTGGANEGASAQIGHGGAGSGNAIYGAVSVKSDLAVTLDSGDGNKAATQIGHGGNGATGAKGGSIEVNGSDVVVEAGGGSDASSRIGHGGSRGAGSVTGAITVSTSAGNLEVLGSDGHFAEAAIGHGGVYYSAGSIDGSVTVSSPMEVIVLAGNGIQASAQIGNGGVDSSAATIAGAVSVTAGSDIRLTGGPEIRSFAQIGNGGATSNGNMSGAINVVSGNDITMVVTDGSEGAYAKIGHGDDLFSLFSTIDSLSGSGTRSGDITVTAASDILMIDSMIGHVNHVSVATALDGVTQIAVSTVDPTDPGAGSIVADGDSEITGEDELRIYLPERSSNVIQAGALLNGEAFAGAEIDPSPAQRDDEFTVATTGVGPSMPGQHSNAIGTGPAPTNAASFAFYYNSIGLTEAPVLPPVVTPEDGGSSSTGGGGFFGSFAGFDSPLFDLARALGLLPNDRILNDWQRENEELFTGFNSFGIYFEGYAQYDSNGGPIFNFIFSNMVDSSQSLPGDFDDFLQILEVIPD